MFKSILNLLLTSSLVYASIIPSEDTSLSKRQSTQWQYSCASDTPKAAPSNFKAFDLGGCNVQLSFNKDRYVGVQWAFKGVYPDGSSIEHKPFRDFNNFGVSDTFYPFLGNNFITKFPGASPFTAIHEFRSVCKGGIAPKSWVFYTTSDGACSPKGYRYTTGEIKTVGDVRRPSKVTPSLRRINDAGDFEVSWSPVADASAYSVIVEYPTGTDEVGNPYRNVRGERINVSTEELLAATQSSSS